MAATEYAHTVEAKAGMIIVHRGRKGIYAGHPADARALARQLLATCDLIDGPHIAVDDYLRPGRCIVCWRPTGDPRHPEET